MTLLDWVAENHWQGTGPAKVGGAGFIGPYVAGLNEGIDEYCAAHTDQFTNLGTFLSPWTTYDWTTEITALLDCDYVCPPSTSYGFYAFVEQYRAAEAAASKATPATFLMTDAHPSYLGAVVEAVGWDALDGSLDVFWNGWWGEDREIVELAEELVSRYHDTADEIIAGGISYMGSFHMNMVMLELIAAYCNSLDNPADEFTSEGLYEFAQTHSASYDGQEEWGYTETRRWPHDYVGVYEWSADDQDIVRLVDEWIPVVLEP